MITVSLTIALYAFAVAWELWRSAEGRLPTRRVTALFFIAFLPQFVDPDAGAATLQIFALGLVFVVIALSSDTLWALAAGTAGVWLRRNRWYLGVKRWVTGIVFIWLGVSSTRAA